jgi:RHS repeat-associated protein
MEIEPASGNIMKTYIYGNSEVLAQHDGDTSADRYFYLHDRLGSVRLVIDDSGAVKNTYTYEPFGEMLATECTETTENPFKFTGQYFDSEIEEYYLRARQYNPRIGRFTSRDAVFGKSHQPLNLHKYIYCANDPVNRVDFGGRSFWNIFGALSAGTAVHSAAIYTVATGVWYDNDTLIDTGIFMEQLVAPAMYAGAALGPLLPKVPGALTKAAVGIWEGVTAGVSAVSGGATAVAKGLSYWAMANPYEFVSVIDVFGQIYGAPGSVPITPAGFVTWCYVNSQDIE